MPARFTLGTWNILATAYIRPDYYPNTPAYVLSTQWRVPAVVRRVEELLCGSQVDILCLQEVEAESFVALRDRMASLGFAGHLAMKNGGKPDGCATFYGTTRCRLETERRLVYDDGGGGPNSGHIAQILAFDFPEGRLDLINTHLKWDPPGTTRDRQWAYRQILQALSALPARTETGVQVICGDFNVTPNSQLVELLAFEGFESTHNAIPGLYTCNSDRRAKLIDHIFFRGPVRAEPAAVPVIDSETPLPSPDQPSDHLPLMANFLL
jgi:mRNA deadenylase 3'-5' endonuclease subunit Ccr4